MSSRESDMVAMVWFRRRNSGGEEAALALACCHHSALGTMLRLSSQGSHREKYCI